MGKLTVGQFLHDATAKLEEAGIGTARLDCLVLLEDVLNTNRTQILANPHLLITLRQQKELAKLINRRVRHEPLAYIRNKSEFYGREFYIDHRVLEPRPETETMIDLLKALPLPKHTTIADVGTGSGALAVTAKLELPKARVLATDIDPGCFAIAERNAKVHGADVSFLQGDLLVPLSKSKIQNLILLCNLPYVPDDFHINEAAMHEPRLAIFGGPDGLDAYRQLFAQIRQLDNPPQYVLTEALPPQHPKLAQIAQMAGYHLETTSNFIQVFMFKKDSARSAGSP